MNDSLRYCSCLPPPKTTDTEAHEFGCAYVKIKELEAEIKKLQFGGHALNIILNGSDPQNLVFVDIENDNRESIFIGDRTFTSDGFTRIRIDVSQIINHPKL